MRQQQIAMLARQLLHALVGDRVMIERLDVLFLPLAGMTHEAIGGLPRLGRRVAQRT